MSDHPQVFGPEFSEGQDRWRTKPGQEPCCLCGRPTRNVHAVFILDDTLIPWNEVADDPMTAYGDFIGWYPIGSTCKDRVPASYVKPWKN